MASTPPRCRTSFDESGLPAGAVYRYFPSKTAIVAAIADEKVGRIIDSIDQIADTDPPVPLDELLDRILAVSTPTPAPTTMGASPSRSGVSRCAIQRSRCWSPTSTGASAQDSPPSPPRPRRRAPPRPRRWRPPRRHPVRPCPGLHAPASPTPRPDRRKSYRRAVGILLVEGTANSQVALSWNSPRQAARSGQGQPEGHLAADRRGAPGAQVVSDDLAPGGSQFRVGCGGNGRP